jgi:biotin-(acetyl-CoA carboxylase) ligase
VLARTPSGVAEGLAVGVEADGALVLQLEDGRRISIEAGDVLPRQG